MSTSPTPLTARVAGHFAGVDWARIDRVLLLGLIAAFVLCDARLVQLGLAVQPPGLDFLPLWTGARVDPGRLYDFAYVTSQQSWLFAGKVRPFIYPPSALLLFKPLGLLPFWPAYVALAGASAALFLWAGRKLGADWRLVVVAMPVVLTVLIGQVSLLVGALVMLALMARGRPILSGVLFGIAGAIRPELLVLLPLALVVAGDWRAVWATGATAAACVLASLPFGASWIGWLEAMPKFTRLVEHDPALVAAMLTPYARWGHASLVLTIPAALAGVWFAFRSGGAAQKTLALLGGALLISPYAMQYQIVLLVPAVLALRKPLLWSLPFWIALICYACSPIPLIVAMMLLFVSLLPKIAETTGLAFPHSWRLRQA
jgi:hypothetical protein